MPWLLIWKVVLAAAAIVVMLNAIVFAVKTTRDAVHHWKAPREIASK
jgi:hypothetical protein